MRKIYVASFIAPTAFTVMLFFNAPLFASGIAPNDYIQRYNSIAMFESLRSSIPASIIMAQAIFESNWGQSDLARRSNNHFGIKAANWNGEVEYAVDDDFNANGKRVASRFRKYATVEQSFEDHTAFLSAYGRYTALFSYDRADYRNWANGLSKCGYATDPAYAQKLIRLIETYELFKLDVPTALSTEPGLQTNLTITTPRRANNPAAPYNQLERVEETSDGTLFEITATPSPAGVYDIQTAKGPATKPASRSEFYNIQAKTGTLQNATTRTSIKPTTTEVNQRKTYRNE